MIPTIVRRIGVAAVLAAAAAAPALAHHGWSWTQDGLFQIEGVIREIYLGIEVEGEVWEVDLAPPRQTERAGFVEGSARAGDEVTAIGNRSRDETERRMKAVRIIVGGETYDVYPNRAPSN